MRKKYSLILFLTFLILTLISFSSALNFYNFTDNFRVDSFEQKCIIQNEVDLYCNCIIDLAITNITGPSPNMEISELNIGDVIFYNESAVLCDWISRKDAPDYLNFNLSCYPDLSFEKTTDKRGDLDIIINTSTLNDTRYYLFFNYTIKKFIKQDPVYNTIFYNLYGFQNYTRVYRTIILPENSVIESSSLYNFNILAILGDDRRIIYAENAEYATVTYRDWNKEQRNQTKRDFSILFMSLFLSLIFNLTISDDKLSNRTKNLLLSASSFLLFLSLATFGNLSGSEGGVGLIILFGIGFLFLSLALSSYKLDTNKLSWKREAKDILKLVRANKLKTFLSFILPILLISMYILNLIFATMIVFILWALVILFMKTNKISR